MVCLHLVWGNVFQFHLFFIKISSWNCSILLYIKFNSNCSGSCAQFAPFANILAGVQSIIYRSSLSVLLPPEELGSVFALLEIFVALIPSGFTPVASWLYNETLSTFPGDSLNWIFTINKVFLFHHKPKPL